MSDKTTDTVRNGCSLDTEELSPAFPSACSSIPHPRAFLDSTVLRDRTQSSFSASAQIRMESGRMSEADAVLPTGLFRSPRDTSGESGESRQPTAIASI